MPHDHAKAVRRYTDLARTDPDAVWDIFDADVVWEIGALAIPDFPNTAHGPDGVREFFRRWIGAFEDWDYEVEETIERGDTVLLRIHQWGRGKGSGAWVDQHFWQIWTMRGPKAVRVTHAVDREEALKAAGPPESRGADRGPPPHA